MLRNTPFLITLSICLAATGFADEPNYRGVMPKVEIGAARFLEKHPQYDGRGVKVAIFDTGVDPGVVGLWTTRDGNPKVIDVIDGTNSGDVDTTTIVKVKAGNITGKTGRKLTIPAKWQNPTGEYRIGIKRAYDFFPGSLIGRLKRERRKAWDEANRQTILQWQEKIRAWEADKKPRTAEDRAYRGDLNEQLAQLKQAPRRYNEPGPLYDCVVFHDGQRWQAAVDTDEDGDMGDEKLMTNYRVGRQYATFAHNSELNFALNIYDDGDLLSIVVDSGAHGTHCAGIVAGHYPEQPGLNGIAPGAQIISVKIGDPRLGSMEVASGIERGLRAAVEHEIDIISMSYGEYAQRPNTGRLVDKFTEVVNEHGIIYVAAAGNFGPALTTTIAPGGTTTAAIGVGALISPEMMSAQYSTIKPYSGIGYTWSSRGPNFDGALGVDIMAPGGAFAAVPKWTLHKQMQMNGTSMATPNTSGGLAVLLSALKATKTKYSPHSIHRAIQNTALKKAGVDAFVGGAGLLQVDAAFGHLVKHNAASDELIRVLASVPTRNNDRGIYLRDRVESERPLSTSVQLKPLFRKDTPNTDRLSFELLLNLKATADWVEVGDRVFLQQTGRRFPVRIDPTKLEPGLHYAEVHGFDAAHPDRGPLIRFPITVIRPITLTDSTYWADTLDFKAGNVARRFIHVPENATWADITLRLMDDPEAARSRHFVMHTTQIQPRQLDRGMNQQRHITLKTDAPTHQSITVEGGHTMEVCLAQFWSSLGNSQVDVRIEFHSLRPSHSQIALNEGDDGIAVEVAADIRPETIQPKATLTRWRQLVRTRQSKVSMLSKSRDTQFNGRPTYQLVNVYEFTNANAGSVTPRFPSSDGFFYDAPGGPHIWFICDEAGRAVATNDVFPSPVRLGKGTHTLELQIRGDSEDALRKYASMPLYLERSIGAVTLPISRSRIAARQAAGGIGSVLLSRGARQSMFVSAPRAPGYARPGDVLLGTISYGSSNDQRAGSGKRPGGYPIRFTVGTGRETKPAATPPLTTKKPLSDAALHDIEFSELKRVNFEADREGFDKLANELSQIDGFTLKVLALRLERLDNVKLRKTRLPEVVKAADEILKRIDQDAIAKQFGSNVNLNDKDDAANRRRLGEQRTVLIDTLYRKGRALGYMELPDVISKHPITNPAAHDKAFEENFNQLRRWVNTTDKEYVLLHIRRDRRKNRNGAALKWLNKYIDSSEPYYWYHKKRRDVYESLGWQHLHNHESRWLVIRFPNK